MPTLEGTPLIPGRAVGLADHYLCLGAWLAPTARVCGSAGFKANAELMTAPVSQGSA